VPQTTLAVRQLLGAHKYSLSYCIVLSSLSCLYPISFSRYIITYLSKIKMGHLTLTTSSLGQFIIHRLVSVIVNLYTKFELPSFTPSQMQKIDQNSLIVAVYGHMTSYSASIVTVYISCTLSEIPLVFGRKS